MGGTDVERTVGWHYQEARSRIDDLLRPLPPLAWDLAVPACPGWRVRDVVAHLLGNGEDGAAGRIRGVPGAEQTAAQVERHRGDDLTAMLDAWAEGAPLVAASITASGMWPAAVDAVTHEHDLRSALGRPGARDHETVLALARRLAEPLRSAPVPVVVDLDGRTVATGGEGDGELRLRTTSFELLRLRMGRRSRAQARVLDWSGDPTAALPHLFVFGPAQHDVTE